MVVGLLKRFGCDDGLVQYDHFRHHYHRKALVVHLPHPAEEQILNSLQVVHVLKLVIM